MSSQAKKLLVTAQPKLGEGMTGFLVRLTELNSYKCPSWILSLAGFGWTGDGWKWPTFLFNDNPATENLAQTLRLNQTDIARMLYPPVQAEERTVTRTYQRMKSALYGEFGSFYSGLHNVLSGGQFDFMRGAFIEYITQNRMLNCLPDSMSHKTVEDSLRSQYILKSDVRRLLGVDYSWINYHIATGGLKTAVRSKGKKRLIFIKAEDIARLGAEH